MNKFYLHKTDFRLFVVMTIIGFFLQVQIVNAQLESITLENQIHDKIDYLSAQDESQLLSFFKEFEKKHHFKPYLVIDSNPSVLDYKDQDLYSSEGIMGRKNIILIIIEMTTMDARIIPSSKIKGLNDQTLQNISWQFLAINLKGKKSIPLSDAIPQALGSLVKIKYDFEDRVGQENKNFSIQWVIYIIMYVLVFILFISTLYFLFRIIRNSLYTAYLEYIRFGSIPFLVALGAGLVLLVIQIPFLIFNWFHFLLAIAAGLFIEGVTRSEVAEGAVGKMAGNIGNRMYKLFQAYSVGVNTGRKDLSVIEARFLVDPKISSLKLMELTFLKLIFDKRIKMEHEWKTFKDGRNKKYLWIEKGANFDITNATDFEKPFLLPLQNLSSGYGYYLREYISIVIKKISAINDFKNDLVAPVLLRNNLISKWEWINNRFTFNNSGKALQKNINLSIKNLRRKLAQEFNQPDKNEFNHLNEQLIMFRDFDQVIAKIQDYFTHGAKNIDKDLVIYPVLIPEFDNKEFERTYNDI